MPNPIPRLSTLELRILEKSAQTLKFMDGAWELLIALQNQFARPEQGESDVMSSSVLFEALATTPSAREARVRSVINTLQGLVFTDVSSNREFVTVNRDLVRWNSLLGHRGLFAITVPVSVYACLLADAWGEHNNPQAAKCLAELFPRATKEIVTRSQLVADLGLSRTNVSSALRKAQDDGILEFLPIPRSQTEQLFFNANYKLRPVLMEIIISVIRWAALPTSTSNTGQQSND